MPCARAHVNQGVAISTGYEPWAAEENKASPAISLIVSDTDSTSASNILARSRALPRI